MDRSRIYSNLDKTEPFGGYSGRIVHCALDPAGVTEWAFQRLPGAFTRLLDLSAGEWDSLLPDDAPAEAIYDFDAGVLPEPPTSEWQPLDSDLFGTDASQTIAESLGCSPSDLIVVPKANLAQHAAKWIADYVNRVSVGLGLIREMNPEPLTDRVSWTSAMGVFYPLAGTGVDRDDVADILGRAANSSAEFVLLTTVGDLDPSATQSISDDDLSGLVARANGFLLGAYDGESYVRWLRTGPA